MIIFPAIDIKDGQCVRLQRGDYQTAHKVAEDPLKTAKRFADAGAEYLHMVDLDGAKDAERKNSEIFITVAKETKLKLQVGGGIRDLDACEYYLSRGIYRVILGSVALKNPELVKTAVKEFGAEKIVVGIDAKQGMVAAEGWLDTSDVYYLDLAKSMAKAGVKTFVFTDISKDGMMSGPNLQQLDAIHRAVESDIIASGGVSCMDDLRAIKKLGIYGAICGKSLYAGAIDLKAAIEMAGDVSC